MEGKIRLAVFGQKRLSREGGIEIVVKELCTRMAQNGCEVTCYNRAGHHVSGAEYDKTIEYALTHKDSVWATLPLEIIGAFRNMIRSFWWNREERSIAKKAFPAC